MKIKMVKNSCLHNSRVSILLLIILAFQSNPVYCQADSSLNENTYKKESRIGFGKERFSISIGSFFSVDDAGITLGSKQLGLGVILDLEDALGLSTSSFVFRGIASYNFGKKNQQAIVLDYFSINRQATKILEADVELGDSVFPVGTRIDSKFDLSIIRAKYEYAFIHDERLSLGFSAGLFIMPLRFSVKTQKSAGQTTSILAPLPLLGIHSDFLIAKKLVLKESIEMLYLKYSSFTGSILDLNFAIEHKTFKNFGFGLGINLSRLNISAKGNDYPNIDFTGSVKLEYNGVLLYARFYL
jgi:hypothetical protein